MIRFVQSKDLAWNFLGDRIIAFNLSGERQFHDLNPTAAFLFQALETPKSEDELVALLSQEFEVDDGQAKTDVQELLADMSAKALIIKS